MTPEQRNQLYDHIERVLDGSVHRNTAFTREQLKQAIGPAAARTFVDDVATLPWVTLTVSPTTKGRFGLQVDDNLRIACRLAEGSLTIADVTVPEMLQAVRAGLKTNNTDTLLSWVEGEIKKLPHRVWKPERRRRTEPRPATTADRYREAASHAFARFRKSAQ